MARDFEVLSDAVARLQATQTFTKVELTGYYEGDHSKSGDLVLAWIEPINWTEDSDADDPSDCRTRREVNYLLTIQVKCADATKRIQVLDHAADVACNVLSNVSLANLTIPLFTKLTRGSWLQEIDPYRTQQIQGVFVYLLDGFDAHDIDATNIALLD